MPLHFNAAQDYAIAILLEAFPRRCAAIRIQALRCRRSSDLVRSAPPRFFPNPRPSGALRRNSVPCRSYSVLCRCSPFLLSSWPCHATAALSEDTLDIASPLQFHAALFQALPLRRASALLLAVADQRHSIQCDSWPFLGWSLRITAFAWEGRITPPALPAPHT